MILLPREADILIDIPFDLSERGWRDGLDVFIGSLGTVLAWPTIGLLLVGVAVGFIVGILPGLGGAVTLALMLPFIYEMDPIPAFAFLLGMHAVVATTGDITSVLFGIPGEATTVATIFDGHPMAQQGQAGRALGAVLFSSLVGAIIGAAALAISIPIVRPLVLSFAPPEFFMLALLGITFVIALSGGNLLKGFLMACVGATLALVGLDPFAGRPRFTFGNLYLWDGLAIVPVVIGLFALPETLQLMSSGQAIAGEQVRRITGVMQGVRDTISHWWLTARCSLIGVFIGFIPGMGGATAQFLAYAHAQQTSKEPERFGKGSIEGVLAAGSVNNSKEGGSIIPTVAFGVPGSTSTAILLGAFLILGLVPGPDMLTKHLNVTFSMVWVIVIANLIAVGVSFLFLRQLVRLTFVPGRLLVPGLLALITIGAYTTHSDLLDVVVMLVFGVVGWVCIRWDWPRAPLLLAFVLGGQLERYLFLSNQLFGWDWVTRPLVLVIGAVALLGLLYSLRRERAARRASAAAA
ncbi:MAG TPA: tripartite tricarboxylate transporter permease [Candidatus Limnocylindria bacterium]|nr:tripartite tricarboxylate transporter permease [Candidatus Limnocylindria bacterium]